MRGDGEPFFDRAQREKLADVCESIPWGDVESWRGTWCKTIDALCAYTDAIAPTYSRWDDWEELGKQSDPEFIPIDEVLTFEPKKLNAWLGLLAGQLRMALRTDDDTTGGGFIARIETVVEEAAGGWRDKTAQAEPDFGEQLDLFVEATYEPPAWVKEWTGDHDVLVEHAEEVDKRVADRLFSSKVEAFEAGRFVGFNTAA